ncbi:endonuclease [Acholeplasma equirhinis]|uniref:endonuclease I family protein n=1 Tax=Acholeplasma equirhinis TaxID=555393 RepID=UPI00197A9999|nr:endonuclease [Acholeplasma equirhinis]MBN3490885.1 endonuclease [Acholeplasma equirhinis]
MNQVYIFTEQGEYEISWFVYDEAGNEGRFTLIIEVTASDPNPSYSGYYATLDGLDDEELIDALYVLLNDISPVSTTYGDSRYIMEESDVWVGLNTDYMYLIYSDTLRGSSGNGFPLDGYGIPTWEGSSTTWNREHVWAKSLIGNGGYDPNNNTRGVDADMHNLRAADTNVNSTRNNFKFTNLITHVDGFGLYNSMWYPGDNHRGDVARIIFYMDIRWGNLTDITKIGFLDTFIAWHLADPVDAFELHRNEVIYGYQGNRNPFIDHPELVQRIYN